MAAGHDKALCEVKLPQFTDDVEAIKEAVKSFVFDTCKAEANWNMTNFGQRPGGVDTSSGGRP